MTKPSVLLLILFSLFASAVAQQTKIQSRGLGNEILMRKEVQNDLGLSVAIRKQIADHLKESGINTNGGTMMIRSNGDSFTKGFDSIAAKLSAPQKQRLDELKVQLAGNRALLDPKIQAKLKLTSKQKQTITDLNDDFVKNNTITRVQGGPIDNAQVAKMQKASKALNDKLGKVLTAAQVTEFKKLQGKPIKKA